MKRYRLFSGKLFFDPVDTLEEHPNGEWVKYEDVKGIEKIGFGRTKCALCHADLAQGNHYNSCELIKDKHPHHFKNYETEFNRFQNDIQDYIDGLEWEKEKAEKPTTPPKVFCKECEYLDFGNRVSILCSSISADYLCEHPLNTKDTWHEPNVKYGLKPQERNKNNDCPLFERKA